ncbi:MAG: hypothetical protein JW807_05630 [Spirochaetes bacterium]|nr:hypothetical protein [Spirochaetota bacterium]
MRHLTITLRFIILAGSLALISQMPDWKYFRDREGNTYFIDQAGKIRIINMPEYRYRPVSVRGIDYYLNYGSSLLKEHRPVEALSVLKSIRALPAENNRIYRAQVKATEIMETMKRRNGPRYAAMDEEASLILYRGNGVIEVINDHMRYSFRVPGEVTVVRKKIRGKAGVEYRYEGVLFGVRKTEAAGEGFDYLMAVDSERYGVRYRDLAEAENIWKGNIGHEGLSRETLARDEGRVLYSFRNSGTPRYAGIEGFFVNGRYGHYARLIASEEAFAENRESMRKIIESFKVVALPD